MTFQSNLQDFQNSRLGIFIHFGLYSLLGRGEWVMNREAVSPADYTRLADQFLVPNFDADQWAALIKRAGARYLIFTTMHHEGFALYDSRLTSFNSVKQGVKRDLVAEVPAAIRREGKETFYELAIPWEQLAPLKPRAGQVFGFNFVVFDSDREEHAEAAYWIGLTPGIAGGQDPSVYKKFILSP